MARQYAELGNHEEALRQFCQLHQDCMRYQAIPETVRAGKWVATQLEAMGMVEAAVVTLTETLAIAHDRWGGRDPRTLELRRGLIVKLRRSGRRVEALQQCEALMADHAKIGDPASIEALETRHTLAHCLEEVGDVIAAAGIYKSVLRDCERQLGSKSELANTIRAHRRESAAKSGVRAILTGIGDRIGLRRQRKP